MAHRDAQMAHDRAQFAKNESETSRSDLQLLIQQITDFLTIKGATPREIREVAEEVLRMKISLTQDQIRELAIRINITVSGLTNIDHILEITRADLERVRALERRAIDAKSSAEDVLKRAQTIIDLLRQAAEAQAAAETAISSTRIQIERTEEDLNTIERITTETNEISSNTLVRVIDLRDRVKAVKLKFTENEINVQRASQEAREAEELANKAEHDANELEIKYADVSRQLELKYNETRHAKMRADELKEKASIMFTSISTKVTTLREMETSFNMNERKLEGLSGQVYQLHTRMTLYLADIMDVAKFHRTCTI